MSGPKDLDEQVYVWVGKGWGRKIWKKPLNKASTAILVTGVGTHKVSQRFPNNSAHHGRVFGFSLRGYMVIDLGFQSTGLIYHSGYSISRHDE